MTSEELETAPSESVFHQIKAASLLIWRTYDDQFGYATEKCKQVESIENFRDNWTFIVSMFDHHNQEKLIDILDGEAKDLVYRATEPNREALGKLKEMGIEL